MSRSGASYDPAGGLPDNGYWDGRLTDPFRWLRRGLNVAKPELGTKRTCLNCGSKFYDLNRDPIVCPSCGTHFETVASKVTPATAAEPEAEAKEEEDETEDAQVEMVSLEEADSEEEETGAIEVSTDDDDDDDVGTSDDEEDTFLEEDDEENDDVSDIVGDVDDDDDQ